MKPTLTSPDGLRAVVTSKHWIRTYRRYSNAPGYIWMPFFPVFSWNERQKRDVVHAWLNEKRIYTPPAPLMVFWVRRVLMVGR